MSDDKAPKADASAAAAEKPKGGSKLLPMLVGVNSLLLLAVVGFMGWQVMHPPMAPAAPAAATGAKAEGHGEEAQAEGGEHGAAKKEEHGEKPAKEEKKEGHGAAPVGGGSSGSNGPMVKIADFVVHLRNPEVDRYARMSFDVEVFGDADKDKLSERLPKVRDAFISYLSDRTLEELSGSEGLGRTKIALQTRLRDLVPEARVRALYISDFVVQ